MKVRVLRERRIVKGEAEERHRTVAAAGRTAVGCAERDRGLGGYGVGGRVGAA